VRYAYFACLAKDRAAFQPQMPLLDSMDSGTSISYVIGSNSERIWEDCKRWGAGL